jgi:hypothetical protein
LPSGPKAIPRGFWNDAVEVAALRIRDVEDAVGVGGDARDDLRRVELDRASEVEPGARRAEAEERRVVAVEHVDGAIRRLGHAEDAVDLGQKLVGGIDGEV